MLFFFIKPAFSPPQYCGSGLSQHEFITSRINDPSTLKLTGNSENWVQYEFYKEKVKIDEYGLRTTWDSMTTYYNWELSVSNDNKTFTKLGENSGDPYDLACGVKYQLSGSSFFHIFRATLLSDFHISTFSITGAVKAEVFNPFKKKVRCTCKIKRCLLPPIAYIIPLVLTFAVS